MVGAEISRWWSHGVGRLLPLATSQIHSVPFYPVSLTLASSKAGTFFFVD